MALNNTGAPSRAAKEFTNAHAAITETATLVFAGKGNLVRMFAENNSATAQFLQIYDAATAGDVTVGTTVAKQTYKIPASGSIVLDPSDFPIHWFALGCVIAVTAGRTNNTAPAAGGSNVIFWYFQG